MLTQIGEAIAPKTTQRVSKGTTRSLGRCVCKRCNCDIEDFVQECVAPDFGSGLWYPWYPLCPECLKIEEENAETPLPSGISKLEKEFHAMCPPAMLETDASRLNQTALHKVLDHKMNGRGLILVGKTGMGKTRSMWLMVRELMVNRGRHVSVHEATELKEILSQAYSRVNQHKYLIDGVCKADVLCIDDLGKEKPSDAWEQDLFTILDRRYTHKRPTIITTNFIGDSFINRYNDVKRMETVVRRMRDMCDGVTFDRYPNK